MKQRVITGVIAGAVFLTLLYIGGISYSILLLGMALIGMFEFMRMNKLLKPVLPAIISYVAVALIVVPWTNWLPQLQLPMLTIMWLVLFLLLFFTVAYKNEVTLDHIALQLVGIFYVGIGFHFMLSSRLMDEHGLYWTLLTFLCIWLTDTGAYFTGRLFGKNKLWPTISPNKTIEGAIGGIVFAISTAILFSLYMPELLSIPKAILFGFVVAIFGQLGDLIQSAYKRIRGVKDAGQLLPGHGGILDRCDSWIIVFPAVQLLSLIP